MKTELKLKYTRTCGKSDIRNGLGSYSGSDYSYGEDLEAYDGFAGDLIVIHVELIASV